MTTNSKTIANHNRFQKSKNKLSQEGFGVLQKSTNPSKHKPDLSTVYNLLVQGYLRAKAKTPIGKRST